MRNLLICLFAARPDATLKYTGFAKCKVLSAVGSTLSVYEPKFKIHDKLRNVRLEELA